MNTDILFKQFWGYEFKGGYYIMALGSDGHLYTSKLDDENQTREWEKKIQPQTML